MTEPDEQPTPSKSKLPKQHPTMKLLNQYHAKLISEQQQCIRKISQLKQQAFTVLQQQFKLQFEVFQKQFYKQKHNLSSDLKTIQYYLDHFLEKHSLNPTENNIYPLFNEIDKKLSGNYTYIDSKLVIQCKFPHLKTQINDHLNIVKAEIMEKQLQEIRKFLAQNQNIRKHCNKQLTLIKDIHDAYGNIYALAQKKFFTPQLQFIGTIDQVLLTLQLSKNIERLTIGIRSPGGKMPVEQYKALISKIMQSKNLLTHLTIKLMDMEFEKQKCNMIKLFVKELKVLKSFRIQNYYKENKLGMFEDFNWYPLKKETHITGKVW